MCGGGGKSTPKPEPTSTYKANPRAVADTSNDQAARRSVIAATDQTAQPTTFGAELGAS
jgi:hypothetical protein